MSRNYGYARPKADFVYSAEDVLTLYKISRNTLGNWIASGLTPSDTAYPRVFRGAELARFHKERSGVKVPLRRGQFKCLGCKSRVYPETATLSFWSGTRHGILAVAVCPDCGSKVRKLLNETDQDAIKICMDSNTNLASLGEGNAQVLACVGQVELHACQPARKTDPLSASKIDPLATSRSGPEPTELITKWRRVRP